MVASLQSQYRAAGCVPAALAEAQRLHAAGISPIPLRYATKKAFGGWKRLCVTRLHAPALDQIFAGDTHVNIGAVMGRISGNLFVLDADTPEAAENLQIELTSRGLKTWKRSSTRGAQWWFRCADGEVENVPLNDSGWEILGHDRFCLAPGSVHPDTGEVIEWLDLPALLEVTIEQMRWLGTSFRLHTHGKKAREKAGSLPPVADKVLVEGCTGAYNADNSRAEWAAVWSLLGGGYSDEEIGAIFERYSPRHYQKVGSTEWRRSCLDLARKQYDQQDSRGGQNSLLARTALMVRSYIESLPWPGATGNTDRALLVALTERMRLDNSEAFRASHRELAVLAGLSIATVGKSLQRLSSGDSPWIVYVGNTDAGATRWKFHPCSISKAVKATSKASGIDTVARRATPPILHTVSLFDTLDADTWHRNALGKSALAVSTYLATATDGATAKETSIAIGKCANTVKSALSRLEQHGLAHADGNRWYASRDGDLAPVATNCGTRGRTESKKAAYDREREIYVTRLTLDSMMRATEEG